LFAIVLNGSNLMSDN